MAAVIESNTTLLSKCLEFCQALTSQGQAFNFSVAIGKDFTFSLDTRSKEASPVTLVKKKASPSTLRRNAKRRREFLQRKQNRSPVKPSEVETGTNALSCDMCEFKPASEKGLRQHKRVKHGPYKLPSTVATPERPRQQPTASESLSASLCWTPTGRNLWRVRRSLRKVSTSLSSVMHIAYIINHRIVAQISPKTAVLYL